MPRVGAELAHPATGERVTVVSHTTDELVLEDLWPGDHVVPPHRHPALTERWRVLEGSVTITIAGREHFLCAGQEAEAAAGSPHSARNLAKTPARVQMTLRPPGRWLELVERLFKGDDIGELLRAYPNDLALP